MRSPETLDMSAKQRESDPNKSEHTFFNALYFNWLQRLNVNTFCSPGRTLSVHPQKPQILDIQTVNLEGVHFCSVLKAAETRTNRAFWPQTPLSFLNTPDFLKTNLTNTCQNGTPTN